MKTVFEGRVHKLHNDINTDYIISSRRKRDTLDLNVLKKYLMEDIDPEFAGRVQAGDILVAGTNFGCGSAMEVASLVVKAAGIRVIVAQSFARTYYRNAINGGLLPIETETDSIADQDRLKIVVASSHIAIQNLTTGHKWAVEALDGFQFSVTTVMLWPAARPVLQCWRQTASRKLWTWLQSPMPQLLNHVFPLCISSMDSVPLMRSRRLMTLKKRPSKL